MDFREIIRRSAEAAGRPLNLDQERVTRKMEELADRFRAQRGMSRRQFLKSQLGLAAFFLAANHVFGHFFQVEPAEAESLDAGVTASGAAEPFIFDIQVPFVHDHYPAPGNLLSLRTRAQEWNPELNGKQPVSRTSSMSTSTVRYSREAVPTGPFSVTRPPIKKGRMVSD